MLQESDRNVLETFEPYIYPMASTPLDTISEEPTAAPTPPSSPAATPAAATAPTPSKSPATPTRVTADPPQTKPAKNPGRVASGKRLAERNRLARNAKKKAQAEAASASASASDATASAAVTTSENSGGGGGLSLPTLLGIGGLIVSAAGLYYQREAIQARFRSATLAAAPQTQTPAAAPAPSRIPVRQGGIKKME